MDLEWIADLENHELVLYVTGVCGALGITRKKARLWVVQRVKNLNTRLKRGEQMHEMIVKALTEQEANKKVISEIHYQLNPNGGGSIKDAVTRIERGLISLRAHDNHRFRELPYPAFECCEKGQNTRVSDAYLDLLGIKSTVDLHSLDWQRFIHTDDIESYFRAFQRAVDSKSDFGYSARFYNDKLENLGQWYIKGPRLDSGCYLGTFIPQDDRAKEIYSQRGWSSSH